MKTIYIDANLKEYAWTDGEGDNKVQPVEGVTSNEAEYLALLAVVTHYFNAKLVIYSDSKLLVNQFNREWYIREPRLRELLIEIWKHIEMNKLKIKLAWLPRGDNIAGKLLG